MLPDPDHVPRSEPVPGPEHSDLSPGEWAVLGVVAEAPTHGFALARLLGPDGVLGRVWTLPRPVVYQALKKLTILALVRAAGTERGDRGPTRTIVSVTPAGRTAVERWLSSPVVHVRDLRSELLLKLALLDRSGIDATPLLEGQRPILLDRLERLEAEREAAAGFDRVLAAWRAASVAAALEFLRAYPGTALLPVASPPVPASSVPASSVPASSVPASSVPASSVATRGGGR